MGIEISSKNELLYGPDIQRFLEDAAEATAHFARRARVGVALPPAQCHTDGTPVTIAFRRVACCCNDGRQTKVDLTAEAERVGPARGWAMALLILGSEIGERLGSTTVLYSLFVYLTTQLNFPLVKAVYISTASFSAANLAPLLGEFLADASFGRFTAVAAGSILYLGGLILFTLLEMASAARPIACDWKPRGADQCREATASQMAILVLSLLLQTAGSGCIRPCAAPCAADQFDVTHSIRVFFCWHEACMASSMMLAITVVIWMQADVGWGWGSLALSSTMGLSLIALLCGRSFRPSDRAAGSPIASLVGVLVAATRKRKLSLPECPDSLYQPKLHGIDNHFLPHTEKLRWLDKAAILEERKDEKTQTDCSPWRICAVHQVEELKKVLSMAPVWLCASASAVVYIQVFTVMTKQALHMDLNVFGRVHVPAASMAAFSVLTCLLFVPLYDACLVTLLRNLTGHRRGLTSLQRVGTGMLIGVLTMAFSSVLENRRRAVVFSAEGDDHPLSALWLVPQLVLSGLGESFVVPGLLQFFHDETPLRLQGVSRSFVWAALGTAGLLSATLVSIIQSVTKTGTANGWLHDDIDRGRIDYFYCTLAVLGLFDFTTYVFVASAYTYTGKTAADLEPGQNRVQQIP